MHPTHSRLSRFAQQIILNEIFHVTQGFCSERLVLLSSLQFSSPDPGSVNPRVGTSTLSFARPRAQIMSPDSGLCLPRLLLDRLVFSAFSCLLSFVRAGKYARTEHRVCHPRAKKQGAKPRIASNPAATKKKDASGQIGLWQGAGQAPGACVHRHQPQVTVSNPADMVTDTRSQAVDQGRSTDFSETRWLV